MLRVFEDAGFDVSRRLEGGTTEVRLEIAPTHTYRAAVDERDHVAVAASLAPFFDPRTVAVVGASTRRGSIGGELFRNILDSDFTGIAYPVNPKAPSIAGVKAYPSIADIPESRRPRRLLPARPTRSSPRPRLRSRGARRRSA